MVATRAASTSDSRSALGIRRSVEGRFALRSPGRRSIGPPYSAITTPATPTRNVGQPLASRRNHGRWRYGAGRSCRGPARGRSRRFSRGRSVDLRSSGGCSLLVYSRIGATSAASMSGGVDRSLSNSTTATVSGTITDWKTSGCSAQTVTAKRRRSEPETSSAQRTLQHPNPGSFNGRTAGSELAYRSSNLCPGANGPIV